MEMGEAGRFAAICRLQQGEHKGFRNLEGHRFMSAVTTVIYTYALNVAKGEGIAVGCKCSGDAHRAKVGDFVGRFSLCVYEARTGGEENEGNEGVDEDR
ncbi:hypothetical protein ALC60_14717 [Trachymyrmex zeteki]|uniref:Uncharacterized protein n=1 Tax=Mycetomoellerius zeteki TaxID=64791 RepID=A0A151WES4_9HYME|nr:hypothetical protein ALC60_14717 [Trachymyrmex zeteki]